MSFLWYWPAGGWYFDAWKAKHDWTPITSEQSGSKDPLPLVSHVVDASAVADALALLDRGDADVLQVVLRFP